jgi:hypothetical protein
MRMLLLSSLLLCGCTVIDNLVESRVASPRDGRIYLGSDIIMVSLRRDMDRYTCKGRPVFCEAAGSQWVCSCRGVSLAGFEAAPGFIR